MTHNDKECLMKDRKGEGSASGLTWQDYLKANAILSVSKTAMVFATQPLQVIMRMQQGSLANKTNPQYLSALNAVKKIVKGNHAPASVTSVSSLFVKGAGVGALKELLKNGIYKGALITGAPGLADKALAPLNLADITSPAQYQIIRSLAAGTIAGCADVVLGGPLEAWATYLSTSQGEHAKANYWQEVQAQKTYSAKVQRIYIGAAATAVKGSIAAATLFITKAPINAWVVQAYDVQDPKKMPWLPTLTSALLSGGAVALTSSPFDIIKTQSQMPNPSQKSVLAGLASNFTTYGIRGVTAGLPLKFVMITMGWALTDLATQIHKTLPVMQNDTGHDSSMRSRH
jgi:hypothetical protein